MKQQIMIEEFKREHSVIIDNFKEIKRLGVYSKESREVILSIQMDILGHLEKEDKQLYPVLKDSVETERKENETLNVFDENISAVSNTAIHFFENYPRKSGNQLARETQWLIEALTWRIQREESFLFAMYENVLLIQ